ncbi:MAG: hypothetical protein IH945_09910 [Armatimonadetes bacterium]|nr:hypothetical protein [Armatimonadota bacterium]
MKNTLILLALISSFVLVGCPKDDDVGPVAPSDNGAAPAGPDVAKVEDAK